jgi:hypothetical protein
MGAASAALAAVSELATKTALATMTSARVRVLTVPPGSIDVRPEVPITRRY